MNILILKLSSMGDAIHTLPGITDIIRHHPNANIDWVIEEGFSAIPKWHYGIRKVIPIKLRSWRKQWWTAQTRSEWRAFKKNLQKYHYDLVIDAQGILKSALLGYFFARKTVFVGYDRRSIRDPRASWFYQKKCVIDWNQHAVDRIRLLCAQSLQYEVNLLEQPDFGIRAGIVAPVQNVNPYVFLLHGTTWDSKLWPESEWRTLIKQVLAAGVGVKMTSGNDAEKARAERLAYGLSGVQVYSRLSIEQVASLLVDAKAAVTVDTGFGHLSAALDIPTVSIFGATDARLASPRGKYQHALQSDFSCSPCMQRTCRYEKQDEMYPPCYGRVTSQQVFELLKNYFDV